MSQFSPAKPANELSRASMTQFTYAAIFLSLVIVIVADIFTARGTAVWVIHIVPVALSLLAWRPGLPLLIAAIATLAMATTFVTDTEGVNFEIALLNRVLGVVTVWTIAGISFFFIHSKRSIDFQRWLQQGQARLNKSMAGDPDLHKLGDSILRFFAEYLGANAGVCFAHEGDGFHRMASYGAASGEGTMQKFTLDDGLPSSKVSNEWNWISSDVEGLSPLSRT